jgi:outer membrane lipoprotein SlyB
MTSTQPTIACRVLPKTALFLIAALPICALSACAPNYSPDSYSSNAVQQANKVDQGVVVGIRPIAISAQSGVGTATGAAAGGITGSQVGQGAVSALGALGGTVAGGLVGTAVEHTTEDATGFEYIVRKSNGDLLSVTQSDAKPLQIGQHVLVIEGPQARVVADYTVPIGADAHTAAAAIIKPLSAPPADSDPKSEKPAMQSPAGDAAAKPEKPPAAAPSGDISAKPQATVQADNTADAAKTVPATPSN